MIARVADGLPLAATMQEDEQVKVPEIKSETLKTSCFFFSSRGGVF